MSQIGGERIPVACRTGRRIGDAARGEDDLRTLLLAFEAPLVDVFHAEDPAAEGHNPRNARVVENLHPVVHAKAQQGVGDVPRLAAVGKDAFAALDVEPDALPLEETDGRAVVEGGEGRGEKRGVRAHLRGELLRRPGVRHVAAPLSRDADLAARLLHLFEQQHAAAPLRRRARGHHARGSRPHDDDVVGPYLFRSFHNGCKDKDLFGSGDENSVRKAPVRGKIGFRLIFRPACTIFAAAKSFYKIC